MGTITIKPEAFLIVDDYESVFHEKVVETYKNKTSLKTVEQMVTIKNSIWDGQSLMDTSLFQGYETKGMIMMRNKFF